MNKLRKLLITLLVLAALVLLCVFLSSRRQEDFHEKYAGVDLSQEIIGLERQGTYGGYLSAHDASALPAEDIAVSLADYTVAEGDAHEQEDPSGTHGNVLFTDSGSEVTWSVNAPEAGFYNLYLEYYLPESKGVPAERTVLINGELPFEDARNISFTRIWTDGGEIRTDNQGNQIRPRQIERYDWQSAFFRDDIGFITEPYRFWLEQGANELTLIADNEPMLIGGLTFAAVRQERDYQQYLRLCGCTGCRQRRLPVRDPGRGFLCPF